MSPDTSRADWGRRHRFIRALVNSIRVEAGRAVVLSHDFDPAHTDPAMSQADAEPLLRDGIELLEEYQARLAAQDTYAVLVILQALDAAGKDGTIKHVMGGVNPQGVEVHSFKQPTAEELDHDFLWRYQRALPARGRIGIFNRSHYEEVLVVRVHPDLLEAERLPADAGSHDLWKHRYEAINTWEQHLVRSGVRVVKIFLNLSWAEQGKRFLARIDEPEKNWKFSPGDVHERQYWDAYQRAFSEMLTHTSTAWAPWHVIPADHKWFAHLATAATLVQTLIDINPRYPRADNATRQEMTQARAALKAELS